METATSNGNHMVAHAVDTVRTVGVRFLRAADRTTQREWFGAAHQLFSWGYRLVEPAREARWAVGFCEQLAKVSLDMGNNDEAVKWINAGDETLSWPARFETPEARLANRCLFTFEKARIFWRLSAKSDGPSKLQLLRKALADFQDAANLFDQCRCAIEGEADLLAADGYFAQARIFAELRDLEHSLSAVQKAVSFDCFMRDPDRAIPSKLHEGIILAQNGDTESAWAIQRELLSRSDLSPEQQKRLCEFGSHIMDVEKKLGKRRGIWV